MRNFRNFISSCCRKPEDCFYTCAEVENLLGGKAEKGEIYHRHTIDAKLQEIISSVSSLQSLTSNYLIGDTLPSASGLNTGRIFLLNEEIYVSDGTSWRLIYPVLPEFTRYFINLPGWIHVGSNTTLNNVKFHVYPGGDPDAENYHSGVIYKYTPSRINFSNAFNTSAMVNYTVVEFGDIILGETDVGVSLELSKTGDVIDPVVSVEYTI